MAQQFSNTSGGPQDHGQDAGRMPWLAHYPPGVDWHKQYEPAPVYALLDTAIATNSAGTCTNFLGRTMTYGDIGQMVDRAAAGLSKLGVARGAKVGLFLPNSPTFIIYYFAVLKLGATIVNFNPLYTLEELTFQVEDSETEIMVTLDLKLLFDKVEGLLAAGTLKRAVICSFPRLLPNVKSVLFKLVKSRELARPRQSKVASQLIFEEELLANDGAYPSVEINPLEDIAVLQYTGGTTGRPKGAMLTHANLYINTQQVVDWAGDLLSTKQRVLGVLPFFHVFAMTVVMNFGIATAAEIIIMPRFVLDDALKLIDKTKPTVMPGVPTLFNAMIHHPKLKSFDMTSLKFCLRGWRRAAARGQDAVRKLTGCKLVEGYGLSETSPVATGNPLQRCRQGELHRPTAAANVHFAARSRRSIGRSRSWARKAKSASRARRS